VIFKNGAVYKG
jgi:hypothetical protein